MRPLLAVMLGSALGGGLRYLISRGMAMLWASPFPLATLVINVVGCFLIGYFSSLPEAAQWLPQTIRQWLTPTTRLMLTTGFCGGFTTFSTFAKESCELTSGHMPIAAILYVALSIVLGLAAYQLGIRN